VVPLITGALLVVTWLFGVSDSRGFDDIGAILFVACFTLFPGTLLVVGGLSKSKKVRVASTRAAKIILVLAFFFAVLIFIMIQSFLSGIGDSVGSALCGAVKLLGGRCG
jgi:ABC-type glycerol-3-phosphate transport system permease component